MNDYFTIINSIMDAIMPRTKVTMPKIEHIIFNGAITKVQFSDGTWSLVKLSENDEPNKEVAILYAIAKRIYGRISYDRKNYGEAVESAIGAKLRKWVETAYDQEAAEKEKRAKAKANAKVKTMAKAKTCACSCSGTCNEETPYVRPNKPFSQFTAEEKRAYWREQNRKRRV